jgi:hypothetical protein
MPLGLPKTDFPGTGPFGETCSGLSLKGYISTYFSELMIISLDFDGSILQ